MLILQVLSLAFLTQIITARESSQENTSPATEISNENAEIYEALNSHEDMSALFSRKMEIYVPLNTEETDFNRQCDQRFLPNPSCYCLPSSHNPNNEDFNSKFNASYADFVYPSYRHLLPIMFYNIVEKMPLFEMGNKLSRIFKASNQVLKAYDTNQPKDKGPEVVPRIMHKIWVTHHSNPFDVPENLWDALKEFLNNLPSDFVVYFWVMDVEPIRRSLTAIKKIDLSRIVIKRAEELVALMAPKTKEFFFSIYNDRKLAKASDVLRFYALYKYGGVFTDLDVTIRKGFLFYLDFDLTVLVFSIKRSHVVEVLFVSCVPRHPSIKRYLNYLENQEMLSKGPVRLISDFHIHWQSPLVYFWGVAVYEEAFKCLESGRTLMFSTEKSREFIRHTFDQSWMNGKYGNNDELVYAFSPVFVKMYLSIFGNSLNVTVNHV